MYDGLHFKDNLMTNNREHAVVSREEQYDFWNPPSCAVCERRCRLLPLDIISVHALDWWMIAPLIMSEKFEPSLLQSAAFYVLFPTIFDTGSESTR